MKWIRWALWTLALLQVGGGEVGVSNQEGSGRLGMPPWLMVASCAFAAEEDVRGPDITEDFFVRLPRSVRPLPETLAEGQRPGFEWRGIKGWMWRPEQYLEEIPVLASYQMNFLMNCYTNMCDVENYPWGDPRCNRWWEDLPPWKVEAYEEIVRACREHGITFCFSMNPNICTQRIVDYDSAEDVEQLWKHYAWMQGLGVRWFNLSLDDITEGIHAGGQARVVNEIFRRLRRNDPQAQMIFCPTYYWGDGTGEQQQPYLEVLARELAPEVYLFWTGDSVVGRITRRGAETFKAISRHRLFLWDNYPVNDNQPAMHLGPVTGRDPDLCEVIDGYMSNSMCTQNQANRIPLLTCADYAYNPKAYDPARSIGQAIVHLAETEAQRYALRDLVEAYPGMLIYAKGPGFNALREQYQRLAAGPHPAFNLRAYIQQAEELLTRLNGEFPGRFEGAKKTLADDVAWLKQVFAEKYGEEASE